MNGKGVEYKPTRSQSPLGKAWAVRGVNLKIDRAPNGGTDTRMAGGNFSLCLPSTAVFTGGGYANLI